MAAAFSRAECVFARSRHILAAKGANNKILKAVIHDWHTTRLPFENYGFIFAL